MFPFCYPRVCSLLLSDPLPQSPEAVCHDSGHSEEVVGRPEATGWKVATILYRFVAAHWRHVLRHFEGLGADDGYVVLENGRSCRVPMTSEVANALRWMEWQKSSSGV